MRVLNSITQSSGIIYVDCMVDQLISIALSFD